VILTTDTQHKVASTSTSDSRPFRCARNRDRAAEEERGGGDGDDRNGPDLVLALDGVRGLEDGPGRLLPEHVAPGRAPAGGGGGGVDAVGRVGLAVPELGQRQRRRGAREAHLTSFTTPLLPQCQPRSVSP
jgi:hypothetical protein